MISLFIIVFIIFIIFLSIIVIFIEKLIQTIRSDLTLLIIKCKLFMKVIGSISNSKIKIST